MDACVRIYKLSNLQLKTYENDPHTSLYISSFQGETVRLGQHIVCHLRTTYTVATSQY